MESVVIGLAVLACPVGMGLMMWFMARGMKADKQPSDVRPPGAPGALDDLRAENARLGGLIEDIQAQTIDDPAPTRDKPPATALVSQPER